MHTRTSQWLATVLGTVLLVACGGSGETTGETGDGVTVCPGATVEGVDVSYWQGAIDFGAVAQSGRKFAIIRVADGYFVDPRFGEYWQNAKAAGLLTGAYHFFRPTKDAGAQADLFLQHLPKLGQGDLPAVLDVEVTDGASAWTIANGIDTWVTKVSNATGKKPLVYTSPGFWSSAYNQAGASQKADLWTAHWFVNCPSVASSWGDFRFWQYSDNGSVPGISGGVDLDRFNGTLAQLEAYAGIANGPPTPKPTPPSGCGTIDANRGLSAGQSFDSCDGRFSLAMQTDGNLVLYGLGRPLWWTGTNGSDGFAAVLQGDGNFVLYGKQSNPLWDSRTYGNGGARLVVQDDGNLVVYAPNSQALWASGTNVMDTPPAPKGCGTMPANTALTAGQAFGSCDGRYALAMQSDGNLVWYHAGTALWATGTDGTAGYAAIMQGDGNFVLYDEKGHALWSAGTWGHAGALLALQNDGNLVAYAGGKAIWATGTDGR